MTRLVTSILLSLLMGCNQQKVFQKPYRFKQDPFVPIYQTYLTDIVGEGFDSEQVSNKTLDPEMIHAIHQVNVILSKPRIYAPFLSDRIKELAIEKITIASAARSAYLQDRLSSSYKAAYLSSFHLLGLAVDLEMKDKSFDIKSHPDDPQIKRNYETLSMVLNLAGLVFSEPVHLDPNHVELFKYCKKKNPNYDKNGLRQKQFLFLSKMRALCAEKLEVSQQSEDGINWQRLWEDLDREIKKSENK